MLDLLIAGGKIVDPARGCFEADLGIEGGKIVGLYASSDRPAAREVLDATGKVVMPGAMDAHVHPGVYREMDDDLPAITRFAVLGGITSMIAFYRPLDPYVEAVPKMIDRFTSLSYIDFGLTLGITQDHQIRAIPEAMNKFGVRGFKYYFGYRGHTERFRANFGFDDTHLVEIFEALASAPGDPLLCAHCENAEINDYYKTTLRPETEHTLAFHDRLNPVFSELDAATRVSLLGSHFGVRVCIVHISAGSAARMLRNLPWVTPERTVIETCPHYLCVDTDDPAGLKAVVRPPVRSRSEVDSLWECVRDGTIMTIGSDNASNDLDAKVPDIWEVRLGFGEMGLTLPLLLSEGYHARGIPLERVAAVTSENIARAHRVYPRKGALLPGSDADVVVVDLDLEKRVDADALKGRPEGSIYAGRLIKGWPVATVVGGRVVARDGEFQGGAGRARYLFG